MAWRISLTAIAWRSVSARTLASSAESRAVLAACARRASRCSRRRRRCARLGRIPRSRRYLSPSISLSRSRRSVIACCTHEAQYRGTDARQP